MTDGTWRPPTKDLKDDEKPGASKALRNHPPPPKESRKRDTRPPSFEQSKAVNNHGDEAK